MEFLSVLMVDVRAGGKNVSRALPWDTAYSRCVPKKNSMKSSGGQARRATKCPHSQTWIAVKESLRLADPAGSRHKHQNPMTASTGTFPVFSIHRVASMIEAEWAKELALAPAAGGGDFKPRDTVHVVLMDGSAVTFKYAFFLVSEEKRAIAVFTEHCGNHVFPWHEATVSIDGRLVFRQAA
jgi:hypothetical protein